MNTTKKFEHSIEFFNREREKEEILSILRQEPREINFIYGPINSGKTTLIQKLIDDLPKDYVVIYINLRERTMSLYKDFLEAIFDVRYEGILTKIKNLVIRQKETVDDVISELGKIHKIPIPNGIFTRIFKEEKPKNAFIYILDIIKNIKKEGKKPVFIIDELQKIGDIKIDGFLIYDVFNFFIRLTKELHICHVFALSSDSLFIERVYAEAMLQGRANYILVDDFDEQTTKKFLEKYNISKEEQEIAYDHFGGKPRTLADYILANDRNKYIEQMILERKSEIKSILRDVREFGDEIKVRDKGFPVSYEILLETLKKFKETEKRNSDEINETAKRYLVSKNILFADCVKDYVKQQSRINLIAIREILKEI